ncbi:Crp/Fnr family transcriptional regulator [Spongiimicrobium salis]|uniref:Crp/Fnr family transcriptional regulator n=1 Tax=Spongiimicrobium salis TaxID=1667022 RepID=UPI00374CF13E
MNPLENYIASYFAVQNPVEIKHISTLFHSKKLKKGAFLLKSEAYSSSLSFVHTGLLRMFALTDGKEVTQWISTAGSFSVDLSSFIFDTPSRWNIQALSDTEVFSISKKDYQNLGKVVQGWNELEKLFLVRCFTELENRVFGHLSLSAEERYHVFFQENKELFNQVPLQYIASMLGMTPETFSRIRKKQVS